MIGSLAILFLGSALIKLFAIAAGAYLFLILITPKEKRKVIKNGKKKRKKRKKGK